jgi:hypothetical protein
MPQFKDAMIDLETLAKGARAHIVQIAAIMFDRETGELGDHFTTYVKGAQPGRTIDPDTVAWWLQQNAAYGLGEGMQDDGAMCLPSALKALNTWLLTEALEVECVWSHGATFDLPILEDAYAGEFGEQPPWHYKAPRDTRTLYDLAPGGMPAIAKDPEQEHDALYDCEIQIKQVVGALAALRAQANAATVARYGGVLVEDAVADTQRAEDGDKQGVWHSAPTSTPAVTHSSSTSTAGIGAVVSG